MRGRTKEEKHKELQDLDPNRFPHLEELMIGGDVDLNHLSLFPQIDSTSMGGIESRESFFKVKNGGERVERSHIPRGKKGTFYSPLPKYGRYAQSGSTAATNGSTAHQKSTARKPGRNNERY
jgi:hypothetical protein